MFKNREIRVQLHKTPSTHTRTLVENPHYTPNDIAIVVKDVLRYSAFAFVGVVAATVTMQATAEIAKSKAANK